ncbi:MAG: FHA domain-containing protein [Planctomycetaceae bacterium]
MSSAGHDSIDDVRSRGTPTDAAPEYARLVIRNQFGALATKDVLRPTTLIGGQPGCNIHLVSGEIAPAHCALTRESDGFHIRDLRSVSGTTVNGIRVEMTALADGAEIQIGPFQCRLETNVPSTATSATSVPANPETTSGFAKLVIRNREGAVVRKQLSRHTILLGSLPQSNVQLVAPEISPAHCLITRECDGLRVRDLRSRNGTRVNGAAMEARRLCDGDCLEIGPFVCLVETELASTAPEDSDRPDRRFQIDRPDRPRADERDALALDRKRLEAEREQFALEQAELADVRTTLERVRIEVNDERAELEKARTLIVQERVTFEQLHDKLTRERRELDEAQSALSRRQGEDAERVARELAAVDEARAALAADGVSLESFRAEFDSDRHKFAQEKLSLTHAQREHLAHLEEFENEKRDFAASIKAHTEDRKRFDAESAHLKTECNRLEDEKRRLDDLARELQSKSQGAEQDREQLAARLLAVEKERSELEAGRADFDALKERFAKEQDELRAKWREREIEFERIREEHGRSRATAEQLTKELADLEQQKLNLLSQMQLFSADSDALKNDRAKLDAAFAALADERVAIEADRARIRERESQLDEEFRSIDELRTQLLRDTQQIEGEQKEAVAERARLTTELQEVTAILSQLRSDRQRLVDEGEKLQAERTALNAEATRINQQQSAVTRALDELEERNDELLHRREQLKAEQAYLRSGKRQFQGALDEFRAEQNRFRLAVASIKANRKGFSRRRETREELKAIRASHWAIPLKAEWILDGELDALSDLHGALLGVLDIGESGHIYVTEDPQSGRRIAVKIASSPSNDPGRLDRIEANWQQALEFRHPNLVQAVRVDRKDSSVRLFLEYIEAINLRELITLHGALGWREVASYAFQAALALESLHASGQMHGAVLPSHLLIEADGTLRMLPPQQNDVDIDLLRTAPTTAPMPEIVDFLAPERIRESSKVDVRSDLYQLGCVLYHALCGRVPFPADSMAEKLDCHLTKLPAPFRRAARDLPKDFALAVKKLMAKPLSERFQTATDAAQAFAPFARRRPAWFSFDAVLTGRSDRSSRQSSKSRPDSSSRIAASTQSEGEL